MKCITSDTSPPPKRVVHKKKKLSLRRLEDKRGVRTQQQPVPNSETASPRHRKRRPHNLQPLVAEEDDRDLAADRNFVLPSDAPRLARQESFRCEGDHDLYMLGLLYEDERLRGPGFNLDSIVHSEPLYAVRPAKRGRGRHREAQFDAENPDLPLDLSFSSLGDDLALARLLAPGADELVADADGDDGPEAAPRRRDRWGEALLVARRRAPLTVIYELEESCALSSNSTSPVAIEPPDLISDDEGEEQFTLLGDESLLDSDEEVEVGGVPSATGDPWIVLGDSS